MNGLWKSVLENTVFVLEFLGVVVGLFILAYIIEKLAQKKRGVKEKMLPTRKIAMIGMFSAIATILHLFDFPLPFAPGFYKLDFSEIPIMIGTFAFGPVSGVMMEFCKILLKLCIKGTSTAFVGDLANFVVGCSLIIPASAVYEFVKTKKGALVGVIAGTISLTVFGSAFNAIYLIPTFANMYFAASEADPLAKIVSMGTAINPAITDVTTLVLYAVVPMNILKGGVVSVVTMLVYKPLSVIIKSGGKS
ncbi:MAG: ECF transporter S component [Lachnospiraceae bacterium]|nr:ECF transporter S component [Lachnospiraceae bacterium]